jgi:hypothetical protein
MSILSTRLLPIVVIGYAKKLYIDGKNVNNSMKLKRSLVLPLVIALIAAGGVITAYAAIVASTTINATVNVLSATASLRAKPAAIHFGDVTPGGSITSREVEIENTGTIPLKLTLKVEDAPEGISVTWNGEGVTLDPGEEIEVRFTLTVASNVPPGTKSFKLVINGEE